MAHPQVEDGGSALHIWWVAVSILNMQPCMTSRGCSFSMGVGQGPAIPHSKKQITMLWNVTHRVSDCMEHKDR